MLSALPETPHVRRLVLRVPDWAGHLPGQHLDVRLTAPDGYTAQRSYSIATAPRGDQLDLVVEALDDGEVSPYLVQEVRAGDELEVRGPVGRWFVWHEGLAGPLQLIAGGSGVVPELAMLDAHTRAGSDVPVRLLYSVRTLADVISPGALEASAARLTLAVTREPTAEAPSPRWALSHGRVDAALLAQHVVPPEQDPAVFVCGSSGFVETVAAALVELGHAPGRVKTERFGASGT